MRSPVASRPSLLVHISSYPELHAISHPVLHFHGQNRVFGQVISIIIIMIGNFFAGVMFVNVPHVENY